VFKHEASKTVLGSGKVTCCLYRGLNDVKTSETTPAIQSKLKPCAKRRVTTVRTAANNTLYATFHNFDNTI